ncbi:hypothetical protein [Sphingomonas faeni]|uniref:hypothetical protein n=1 Tax=Sphingomonas faeni TaxID=185950 RepID=UPI00334F2153
MIASASAVFMPGGDRRCRAASSWPLDIAGAFSLATVAEAIEFSDYDTIAGTREAQGFH